MSNTYTFANLSCDTFDVRTSLDMCGFAIQNLAAPTAGSSDAARQQEISSATGNLSTKLACRLASVSNISDFTTKATVEAALDTISASAPTLADGDRVLVRAQSNNTQNGIYYWNNGAGELQRAADADGSTGNEVSGGDYTFITQGDNHGQLGYIIIGSGVRSLGVDAIVWSAFTGQNNVSHTTLSNIGVNTHTQISSHIADATIHFTEASISHTNLLNKGTNTHAQIDSHIASTSNPHSVTIDQITPTTTKGDTIVRNASTDVRFGVGTDGQILVADSTQATGLSWITPGVSATKDYERFTNYGLLTNGMAYKVQDLAYSPLLGGYFGGYTDITNNGLWYVVSDPADDTTAIDAGLVYIYRRTSYTDQTFALQQSIQSSDIQASDFFGKSLAIASGVGTYIVVGAPLEDTGLNAAGSVYTFFWNGSTWSQINKLQSSDAATTGGTQAYFGHDVDIDDSGTYLVVGAPQNDSDGANRGRAFIYTRSGSSWTSQIILSDPNGISGGLFGVSVAIEKASAEYVAVGRPYTGVGAGYVYIYQRSSGTLLQTIRPLDIASITRFGLYLRLSKNTLCVGTDDTTPNDGYIFYISNNGYSSEEIQKVRLEGQNGATLTSFNTRRSFHVSSDGLCLVTSTSTASVANAYSSHIWNNTSVTSNTCNFLINVYKRNDVRDEFKETFAYPDDIPSAPTFHSPTVFTGASSSASDAYYNDIGIVYSQYNVGNPKTTSFVYIDNRKDYFTMDHSKDGNYLITFICDTSLTLYTGGVACLNIYAKSGNEWVHKVFLTTQYGNMDPNVFGAGNESFWVAMSGIDTASTYYIALYPGSSFYPTLSDQKQKIYVFNYDGTTFGYTALMDLQDGSGGAYTPTVNALVYGGLDCDVSGTTPYYMFGVIDGSNRYIRYRTTAGSYGFVGPFTLNFGISNVQMYGQYGSAYSSETSAFYVFRSSGSVQTISTSSSYVYTSATESNFADNGDKLITLVNSPQYKQLPSTFISGARNRFDLFQYGGSTYDFVRPLYVETPKTNNFTITRKIPSISEDGYKILFVNNNQPQPCLLEHDNVSTEWNVSKIFSNPFEDYNYDFVLGQTYISSRDNINAITLFTSKLVNATYVYSTMALNADEPDPTQTTSSAAKSNGSSVGDYITDDSNQLIRVMNVATHALDPEWITPISITPSLSLPLDRFYVENTTEDTNATTTLSTYLTTTQILSAGTYLIEYTALFAMLTNTTDSTRLSLRINGVSAFDSAQDWYERPTNSTTDRFCSNPFVVISLSGATTFAILYATTTAGAPGARMYYASVHGVRLA